jgi:hypothetical protein
MKAMSESQWTAGLRLVLLIFLLPALILTGCKSSSGGGGAASFASVVIPNANEALIRQTTVSVFKADGYEFFDVPGGGMLFEKPGSLANDIAYGGWIEDRGARVRVKAEIILLPEGSHRLQCQVYMVQHAGDTFFQEEHKLSRLSAGPYRKLLNAVATRLQ